jgi:hypothetical protein
MPLIGAAELVDADGEGSTKWKRLHNAVAAHQNPVRDGRFSGVDASDH